MEHTYAEYAAHQAVELLAIDSPTGFTRQAAEWVLNAFRSLGYEARTTVKGGVLIDLGGSDENDGLLLEAHADTLGGMVAEIKGTGRLRLTALGGMRPENGEAENVRLFPARNGWKWLEHMRPLSTMKLSIRYRLSYSVIPVLPRKAVRYIYSAAF